MKAFVPIMLGYIQLFTIIGVVPAFAANQDSNNPKPAMDHINKSKNNNNDLVKQTNLLFIMCDDLRPEMSIYGRSFMHTPNFER